MGILYNDSKSITIQEPEPSYLIKYVYQRSRPRRRRNIQKNSIAIRPSLPLSLSGSILSENPDIARFLRESETDPVSTTTTPIQHRDPITVPTTPQSLPPLSESISESCISVTPDISRSASPFASPFHSPLPLSPAISLVNDEHDITWEFLTTTSHTTTAEDEAGVRTPASEPETWILLSDDS